MHTSTVLWRISVTTRLGGHVKKVKIQGWGCQLNFIFRPTWFRKPLDILGLTWGMWAMVEVGGGVRGWAVPVQAVIGFVPVMGCKRQTPGVGEVTPTRGTQWLWVRDKPTTYNNTYNSTRVKTCSRLVHTHTLSHMHTLKYRFYSRHWHLAVCMHKHKR